MAKMDLLSNSKEEKGTTTKVLGPLWDKVEDVLNCDVSIEKDLPRRLTKRIVLSKIQQVFDLLGVYNPIFLPPKLFLQRSWELKIGWDSQLPEDMDREFRTWYSKIGLLSEIKIPRHIWFDQTNKNEIHAFCDASKSAYAAEAYMRSEVQTGVHLSLLWSKSSLAPFKRVTIPRLELRRRSFSIETSQLSSFSTLSHKSPNTLVVFPFSSFELLTGAQGSRHVHSQGSCVRSPRCKRRCKTIIWSDSSTALSWIKRGIEWRVFVRNRVKEIQSTTNVNNWRFVSGYLNPADLLSRGCSPLSLCEGPEWLKQPKESWPRSEPTIDQEDICSEEEIVSANINVKVDRNDWLLTRRSDYSLNIRIMSYVLRFIGKLKKQFTETGPLKVSELDLAEMKLVKIIQEKTSIEKSSSIQSLKIFKNSEGLWCIESKPLHGQVPEEFKTPAVLPGDHPFVKQLIWEMHRGNGHAGVQSILSILREKFWIIREGKL
ncbi:hypothetical protein LAZ67_9002334 [Cordylochernes scorpioides]|uniref:Integrase zinc-binding domain-containing protein n=1 Tax=Cordylochernes scorpioides TaxID=51811 RepID=A0ABY6KVF0_9ARAC|nr:hypothetical protein LAZ67_9002334 [Cordylochernes scorpioides]